MSVDANDVLFGGGTPAATFKSPGDTFAGPIVKLEAVQARKFGKDNKPTDELDTWPNGDPKMQAVVTLKTDHRDPSDPSDDGQRKVYVASRDLQQKVRAAVKAVGKRALDIGGILQVTFVTEEKQESGLYAKIYEVSYTPAGASAANAALGVTERVQEAARNYQPAAETQATVPPVQQLMGQEAAPAGGAPNLENLPAEARAMVERMLAQQQQS